MTNRPGTRRPGQADEYQLARLEINARSHRYNARLDKIADAMDRGDVEAWQKLPARVIGEASAYLDLRRHYRDAVEAGAVPDDRSGPSAA